MSYSHTYNNHLKYGFEQTSRELIFRVQPGKCSYEPALPIFEAARAAQLIAAEARDAPLHLCMSGGIDSEAMAEAFLKAQIPFQAAIMRFKNDLNKYDIQDAENFCHSHNIAVQYIDLDIIDFFESGTYFEYGTKYKCASPQLAAHLYMLDHIDGVPVLTWNPPAINIYDTHAIIAGPASRYFCYDNYFKANNRFGVGMFFLYTPELLYSFLRLPFIQAALQNPSKYRSEFTDTYKTKVRCYNEGGFKSKARVQGYTGFEKVKEYFHKKYNDFTNPIFDQLYRQPLIETNLNESRIEFKLNSKDLWLNTASARC